MLLGDEEDLSFASMFNSMRLEEDEPQQAVHTLRAHSAKAELDPVVPYGSFGQVSFRPASCRLLRLSDALFAKLAHLKQLM